MKNDYVYPLKITKFAEDDYYFEYPFEGLKVIGGGETLFEALELAQSSLEFALFDLYKERKAFLVVTEQQIMELNHSKKEDEYITLVRTDLKTI